MGAGTALTVDPAERTNNQDARLGAAFRTRDINGWLRAIHAAALRYRKTGAAGKSVHSVDHAADLVTGQPIPSGTPDVTRA